ADADAPTAFRHLAGLAGGLFALLAALAARSSALTARSHHPSLAGARKRCRDLPGRPAHGLRLSDRDAARYASGRSADAMVVGRERRRRRACGGPRRRLQHRVLDRCDDQRRRDLLRPASLLRLAPVAFAASEPRRAAV